MLFMGMFMLFVLPLFLLVCARMVKQSSFGERGAGVFLEIIFYTLTILSVLGSIIIIIELL